VIITLAPWFPPVCVYNEIKTLDYHLSVHTLIDLFGTAELELKIIETGLTWHGPGVKTLSLMSPSEPVVVCGGSLSKSLACISKILR
jgi:hypothetical protein